MTLEEMPQARLLMRARDMRAGTTRPVLQEAMRTFAVLARRARP